LRDELFLLGVPVSFVRAAYLRAPGNEIESGKFANVESSARLVANTFGLFYEHPAALPALPRTEDFGWPAELVEPEAVVRLPWHGGRHPCLDVLVVTADAVIGIESKRYEPFRNKAAGEMSAAYWRSVWGSKMAGYESCRDEIRDYGGGRFARLDVAQLVKHAFALRTAVHNVARWAGRRPVLYYLYAEPERWPGEKGAVPLQDRVQHRAEIAAFSERVADDEVSFVSCSYSELLERWAAQSDPMIRAHSATVAHCFRDL
jgi:hypothetical protein